MESKKFDHIIKSKLEGMENIPFPSDWELFHSKYRDELGKNDEIFDQAIHNKFASLEVPYNESHWLLMKEELEKEEIFDQAIHNKFVSLEVPYNESHWLLMKEELEKEEFIRTSIYFSKIVEAACIFLILFTFLNIFPSFHSNIIYPIALKNEVQDDQSSKNEIQDNQSSRNVKGKQINPSSIARISEIAPISKNAASLNINGSLENNFSAKPNNLLHKTLEFIPTLNSKIYVVASNALINRPQSEEINQFIQNNPSNTLYEKFSEDAVAMLSAEEIEPLKIKRSFYRQVMPTSFKNRGNTESYLSFNIAPTVNIVNSPFDYVNKTASYNTDALGGEIGVNYSIRKNNIEIETGLNFGRKSYSPRQVDEVIGSFLTSFRRLRLRHITYDVFTIPITSKLHFANGNGWSFYALAGTSINGIAKSDYLVEENGQKISIYDVQTNYRESNTARKNYNPGIIEGGNILDNIYFTFDFGIGVEHKISESTLFYLAPTLRQHIGLAGVGPNNDKVNSLGLNMGIKKRL